MNFGEITLNTPIWLVVLLSVFFVAGLVLFFGARKFATDKSDGKTFANRMVLFKAIGGGVALVVTIIAVILT